MTGNVLEAWLQVETPMLYQSNASSSNLENTYNSSTVAATELDKWHHRLGHASTTTLKFIPCVKPFLHQSSKICITCPMSKFTKLLFSLSDSHTKAIFDLIHIDI